MRKRVIIRADGGTTIGLGHVVRCLALADMLKKDFDVIFAIQQPDPSVLKLINDVTKNVIILDILTEPAVDAASFLRHLTVDDIVVLDGYNFKTEYQQLIKAIGCKLVAIDDLHAWHHVADVIINHAEGLSQSDYSNEEYTRFCLGLNYALLRKEFLEINCLHKEKAAVRKVFISMGAADINNITQKFTETLLRISNIEEIHLMLSTLNPHLESLYALVELKKKKKIICHFNISSKKLVELLRECDICICPASSISLESCAVGIGLVSGYTAENQNLILKGLVENNACISLDDLNKIEPNEIRSKIQELTENIQLLNLLIKNQSVMIDGKSGERLLSVFKEIIEMKKLNLYFRFATEDDTDLYYEWANDALVRDNSYSSKEISYTDHVNWFHQKLGSKAYFFYLFLTDQNQHVGQVRVVKGEETVIGISIDKEFRGRSLGKDMLLMACADFFSKNENEKIVAYIKLENSASYTAFKKAGFYDIGIVDEQGYKSYKLIKSNSNAGY